MCKKMKRRMTQVRHKTSLRRTACNRCRSHKLRCLRDDASQPKCDRCNRLNAVCEIGKAGRPGRPRKQCLVNSTASSGSTSTHSINSRNAQDETERHAIGPLHYLLAGAKLPIAAFDSDGDDLATGTDDFGLTPSFPWCPVDDEVNLSTELVGVVPAVDPPRRTKPAPTYTQQHECLRDLSHLYVDLHADTSILRQNRETENIFTFFWAVPKPVGDGSMLFERLLNYAQSLNRIMSNLDRALRYSAEAYQESRQSQHDENSFHATPGTKEPRMPGISTMEDDQGRPTLDTPVVLLLVSCYAQIIEILEILIAIANKRLETIFENRQLDFSPTRGFQIGSFYSCDGRMEGLAYLQTLTCLLDRIERGLGLPPDPRYIIPPSGRSALLSCPHHFELLHNELGSKGPEGKSTRPQELRDSIESARLMMLSDTSW